MVQQSSDDSTSPQAEQRGVRLGGGAIASLTGAAALIIFMVQNTDDVTVSFLVWEFTWPVWLLILVSALIGCDRVDRVGCPATSPAAQGPPRGSTRLNVRLVAIGLALRLRPVVGIC